MRAAGGDECARRQAARAPRMCRFYAGEMLMGLLAVSGALAALASGARWSFAVFLTLQGASVNAAQSLHVSGLSLSQPGRLMRPPCSASSPPRAVC